MKCPLTAAPVAELAAFLAAHPGIASLDVATVVDKAFKQCGQPPSEVDLDSIALMLQRSDGLSAEWVG